METVEVEVNDGVGSVTIDNPPVNQLPEETLEALGSAVEALEQDNRVRALVLTGAGEKTFAAGADLKELQGAIGDRDAMQAHVAVTRRVFSAWARAEKPTIAAVAASAVGGGLELALVCDLIVADPAAKLGFPEVGLGLIPGAGGTQRLPRRVGAQRALRLLVTGALLPAKEAAEIGLVDRLSSPGVAREEAHELAAAIAAQPALAVRAAKALVRGASESALDDGLERERDLFLAAACSTDAAEGVAAFLGRREPRFTHS